MDEILAMIRKFGQEFASSLYDTGFGDVMACGGVQSAETREDMRTALSFVNGYAQACRLANVHNSPQWLICNDVASFAGQVGSMLDTQENIPLPSASSFKRAIDSARDCLQAHLRMKVA